MIQNILQQTCSTLIAGLEPARRTRKVAVQQKASDRAENLSAPSAPGEASSEAWEVSSHHFITGISKEPRL